MTNIFRFIHFRFVLDNEQALRRQKRRRSFSPGRSRSGSPYKYRDGSGSRSHSRSPHYKATVSHIVRKRTRSITPENSQTKFARKSRSPRRAKEQEKPKYPDNDRMKRNRNYKFNGNGNTISRDRHGNERKPLGSTYNSADKDKRESGLSEDKKVEKIRKSKSPAANDAKKSESKSTSRDKTEQELEDELLASTDSEGSIKAIDDDEIKVTLDEKDLDFLDDDEEESENEGRFKSKPTSSATQQKKPLATTSFRSSFGSKNYEKPKNFNDKNYSRHDYKRGKYNEKDDSRRDNKTSRSPTTSSQRLRDDKRGASPDRRHKKSPEVRKSPEVTRKISTKEPTAQTSKVVVISKETVKDESKKIRITEPKFKPTFKTVEPQVEVKKKGKNQ